MEANLAHIEGLHKELLLVFRSFASRNANNINESSFRARFSFQTLRRGNNCH